MTPPWVIQARRRLALDTPAAHDDQTPCASPYALLVGRIEPLRQHRDATSPGGAQVRGDRAGDLTRVIQPEDWTDAFARDARGAEVAWTDGTGAKVAIVRDALGAAASLADPADASSAPDFLAVAGRDAGIAGYARKEEVLSPGDAPFPVYGDDLRTVVGQMVPNRGFVQAGVEPATIPTFAAEAGPSHDPSSEASGQVVLYVRNDASEAVWVTVQVAGQPWNSTGFWGQNLGVGCYAMPVGSRLVLLDRAPTQAGASIVRTVYTRGQEPEPPSLWITIGADGASEQGDGVPAWWGQPQVR